jgi:hypothetical protein
LTSVIGNERCLTPLYRADKKESDSSQSESDRVTEDRTKRKTNPDMATVRTPTVGARVEDKTPSPKAGPSSGRSNSNNSVRRSIGEWEKAAEPKPRSKTQEAKNCLLSAKKFLEQSRNLRTDIKDGVNAALARLFQLVKEAEEIGTNREKGTQINTEKVTDGKTVEKLIEKMTKERKEWMKEIKDVLKEQSERERKMNEWQNEHMRRMKEMKEEMEAQRGAMHKMTYAGVVASKPKERETLHSVIVTAQNATETGEEVLSRIRQVIKAKEGGMEVEQVRKTKDRKVIVSCRTKDARRGVKEAMQREGSGLVVEEVQNRSPLLVLKDVLKMTPKEDICQVLRSQNRALFDGLDEESTRMDIKYERRARNPHARHVVMAVTPGLWSRALEMGAVRLDLQRVRVEDQSPLVQCSTCLGYGHGKKYCKETQERCSHCGGPHLRAECEVMLAGLPPSCTNCCAAKMREIEHNAFDAVCPIRKRWDAIARSRVAYC